MTLNDSLLSDAGSLFFTLWVLLIAGVSAIAFGRDLLPNRAQAQPASKPGSTSRARHFR